MIYIDRNEFKIQDYKHITYVTNQKITILTQKQTIDILGNKLSITYYTPFEIRGSGEIRHIKFGEQNARL